MVEEKSLTAFDTCLLFSNLYSKNPPRISNSFQNPRQELQKYRSGKQNVSQIIGVWVFLSAHLLSSKWLLLKAVVLPNINS